jgi:small subunit ribosomal protein S2
MSTVSAEPQTAAPVQVALSQLIEAGVHFGHRASRWNPKMKPFIFGKRNLIHIIDLRATVRGLIRSIHFVESVSAQGGEFVFVGTKRQARALVKKHAQLSNMHWVSERWLGGTLTNFSTIMGRIKRLEELEALMAEGAGESFSKKMLSSLRREYKKIVRNLEGVRNMTKLPDVVVVVDPGNEHICVREARKLGIPVVALMDTDGDPATCDLVIPGNDDAYRSIDVVMGKLSGAIARGRDRYKRTIQRQKEMEEQRQKEEAERQRKIREARDAAQAERKKIEDENAARIAEARAKLLAERGQKDGGKPAAEPAEAPPAAAEATAPAQG